MQVSEDNSFIGGKPKLPLDIDIPVCDFCGEEQTFFFQVAFPQDHFWEGKSMAMFSCTSCAHKGYLIPEMLPGHLSGVDIPEHFLDKYQKNFRIFVFESSTSKVREDYKEKIAYRKLSLVENKDVDIHENKIGGAPNWLLEDESPNTYRTEYKMEFLMQIVEDYEFETVPGVPHQMWIGYDGKPKPSPNSFYELFLANNIYFFGTVGLQTPKVYVITQI